MNAQDSTTNLPGPLLRNFSLSLVFALACDSSQNDEGGMAADDSAAADSAGSAGIQLDGGGQDSAGEECLSTQVRCEGQCIDPLADVQHCGASGDCGGPNQGQVCDVGQACLSGQCQNDCGPGRIACDGSCVDPWTDPRYCGAMDNCAGPGQKGSVCAIGDLCVDGQCTEGCPRGEVMCDGRCIDPLNDPSHCGAGQMMASCSDDPGAHCGADEVCDNGDCVKDCEPGEVECTGHCIDPLTDSDHCGASLGDCSVDPGVRCERGLTCVDGACAELCQPSQVLCDGHCIDPADDLQYCGASGDCSGTASGESCRIGERCRGGECVLDCDAGLVACEDKCIDPQTDPEFCGAKGSCRGAEQGAVCDERTEACVDGECVLACMGDDQRCDADCVDVKTNADHCGGCDQACVAGQVCSKGACHESCAVGELVCFTGGVVQCIDPQTNGNFCGAVDDCEGANKGTWCGPDRQCVAGNCEFDCPTGQVGCGIRCINPKINPNFCGVDPACMGGTQCDAAKPHCVDGTCLPPDVLERGFIWIANSSQGTVSKIDTKTMVEMGRYYTRPDHNGNPSRTSVDIYGAVAVANRHGGVTKLAAFEEKCIDRNGNGTIETSRNATPLPFAEEECILWENNQGYESQRAAAWAAIEISPKVYEQKLWVGARHAGADLINRYEADTGAIEHSVNLGNVFSGHGPYGGAVDSEGNFWVSGVGGGKLYRIAYADFSVQSWDKPGNSYGVAVDDNDKPWVCGAVTARFDPATEIFTPLVLNGMSVASGGCMSDGEGAMWLDIVQGNNSVGAVDILTMAFLQRVPLPEHPHGISIDFEGKVWGVGLNSTKAYRVDPMTGTVDTFDGLVSAYTYSDMTGFALRNLHDDQGRHR